MATVREICDFFNTMAPFYMKLDFDNVGHLAGRENTDVSKALLALDITDDVVDEAVEIGAQLIVSHHPMFFDLKKVVDSDTKGRKIIKLIENGMSAICLHTNMDAADGGVNDALMVALGARDWSLLTTEGTHPDGRPYGISRVGELREPMSLEDFLKRVKNNLASNGLRYHNAGRPVYKIACCGGSGGGEIKAALDAGCDTYVTSDIKYDQFLQAKEAGINLIDADHFCTENVVVPVMARRLKEKYPDIEIQVSKAHRQTAEFF